MRKPLQYLRQIDLVDYTGISLARFVYYDKVDSARLPNSGIFSDRVYNFDRFGQQSNMTSDTDDNGKDKIRRRTRSSTRAEEITTRHQKQRSSQPDKP